MAAKAQERGVSESSLLRLHGVICQSGKAAKAQDMDEPAESMLLRPHGVICQTGLMFLASSCHWLVFDWSQNGVAHLFSLIEDGKSLPDGPIVISPDDLFPSLYRESFSRKAANCGYGSISSSSGWPYHRGLSVTYRRSFWTRTTLPRLMNSACSLAAGAPPLLKALALQLDRSSLVHYLMSTTLVMEAAGGTGVDMLTEEEIRSHPAYLVYYFSNEHSIPGCHHQGGLPCSALVPGCPEVLLIGGGHQRCY